MSARQMVAAELTWTGERFEEDVLVEVGEDGRIAALVRPPRGTDAAGEGGGGAAAAAERRAADGSAPSAPVRRLPRRALLPGFVDAHSHAFQRGLRGRGETFPAGAGDFWSWRTGMYDLVEHLDAGRLYELSLAAFREMRAAGITAVGEFHYLHHADPAATDFAFDEVVLAAAAAAPIRIVLLEAFYASGGIGRPLDGAQRRFAVASPEAYWRQIDRLAAGLAPDGTQTLGAVAHSIRAATPEQIAELWHEARRRGLPFHMHVEEQRREIEQCRAAHGRPPLAILLDEVGVGEGFTAVHCTHSEPAMLARFAAAGGRICVCPLTEANLGDGLPPLATSGGGALLPRLCLGSDSNARISMAEEGRWLEYGQRLAGERRGALADAAGRVGPGLLAAATRGGAESLALPAGEIAAGRWADFASLDLDHPTLAGATPDTLLEAFFLGAGNAAVAETAVAGRWSEGPAGAGR